MKFIRTATTFILMMLVHLQAVPVHAQRCSEACPNEDRPGCWISPFNHQYPWCSSGEPLRLQSGNCNAWCRCMLSVGSVVPVVLVADLVILLQLLLLMKWMTTRNTWHTLITRRWWNYLIQSVPMARLQLPTSYIGHLRILPM